MRGCLIFAALLVAGLVLAFRFAPDRGPAPAEPVAAPPAVAPRPAIDKSDAKQAERKAFIEKAIADGYFLKVEKPAQSAHVYVTQAFRAANVDQKEAILGVVYAYFFDGTDPLAFVRVRDAQTGKELGQLTTAGLEWSGD